MNYSKRLFLFSFLPLASVSLCGCQDTKWVEPTFEKGDGISFVAYAGPTVENWNGVVKNVECVTEHNFSKLSEAGFDRVIALYEGATSNGSTLEETLQKKADKANKDAMKVLEQAEKFGIDYYARDWSFYGMIQNNSYFRKEGIDNAKAIEDALKIVFSSSSEYLHSPSYRGNFCFDEPVYDELPLLGDLVDAYLSRMKELGVQGEPMVDLNPIYVSGPAMGGHSYSEYLDRYIEYVGKKIGYISYDFYPFMGVDGSYIRSMYLANLEVAAQKCQENGIELRTFIQAMGDFTGIRDLTSIADFRFQVYTNLAFGSKAMTYYCYANEKSASEGSFALFNYIDGTYNYTYDLAKKVNNEIHAFEDALTPYTWSGVLYHNANELYDNQNFMNLTSPLESHPRVSIQSGTEDTLLSTFKHEKNGDDSFLLLNFSDPYFNKEDKVTLQFKDAKALLMYRFGQKMIAGLPKDGTYTFSLYPGEGRYIIPLK